MKYYIIKGNSWIGGNNVGVSSVTCYRIELSFKDFFVGFRLIKKIKP